MGIVIDIHIAVRYSSVFHYIDASIDQKLCSKRNTIHGNSPSRLGNSSAGCVSLSMTEGTVTISGQSEPAQIFSLGIIRGGIFLFCDLL